MGTWGFGTFEDDTACDWAAAFVRDPSRDRLRVALNAPVDGRQDLDDLAGHAALVSAEVIAAMRGHPSEAFPQELAWWIEDQSEPTKAEVVAARKAVRRVFAQGEIRDEWEEGDCFADWKAAVDDLLGRLKRATKNPVKVPRPKAKKRRKTAPVPCPPAGSAFLWPLDDGCAGVCRVLRTASETEEEQSWWTVPSCVVAFSSWIGKRPPKRLDRPEVREILVLDAHSHAGREAVYLIPGAPPAEFALLGSIPPTPRERALTGTRTNSWTVVGSYAPAMQRAWDAARARYCARRMRAAPAKVPAGKTATARLNALRRRGLLNGWKDEFVNDALARWAREILDDTLDKLLTLGDAPAREAVLREIEQSVRRFTALQTPQPHIGSSLNEFGIGTLETHDLCEAYRLLAEACGVTPRGDFTKKWRAWKPKPTVRKGKRP